MASARKPEALVWTDDELGLLQETRTQACSPPLLLLYTKECFRVDGKLAWLSSRLISCWLLTGCLHSCMSHSSWWPFHEIVSSPIGNCVAGCKLPNCVNEKNDFRYILLGCKENFERPNCCWLIHTRAGSQTHCMLEFMATSALETIWDENHLFLLSVNVLLCEFMSSSSWLNI